MPAGCSRRRSATAIACGSTAGLDGCPASAPCSRRRCRGQGCASQLHRAAAGDGARKEGALLAWIVLRDRSRVLRAARVQAGSDRRSDGQRRHAASGAPAMLVRAGDDRDLPAVEAMHQVRSLGRQVRASPRSVDRFTTRCQEAAAGGSRSAGLRQVGVRRRRGRCIRGRVRRAPRERERVDARRGRRPRSRRARLGAMLQVLVAREPSAPTPLIRAWWPACACRFRRRSQLTDSGSAHDLFMVKPLADVRDAGEGGGRLLLAQ